MIKANLRIEIVRSTTSWLSSMSQESCDSIYAVLARHYTNVGVTVVNTLADLEALVVSKPDLVFLGMKFVPIDHQLGLDDPNKVWLAAYLDQHNIAYTGSSSIAHELELNKPLAKQRTLDAGLKTSPFCVINQNQSPLLSEMPLDFPVFIKPTNRGGGMGIDSASVAHDFDELTAKVQSITDLQSDSLIEEYLPGREFSVAILKDELTAQYSVMPLELIAPADQHGNRILSEAVKHADTESFVAVTDEIIWAEISTLALDVFHAIGARDYGRIDIRLDSMGTPHFLEANLIPSLIEDFGNFPKACLLNINMDYEPMILSIVNLALARSLDLNKSILEPAVEYSSLLPIETTLVPRLA